MRKEEGKTGKKRGRKMGKEEWKVEKEEGK